MRFLDRVDEDWWWDVAGDCSYTTFFHTPLWHRLAARTFTTFESVPVGAIAGNGTRVVLPALRTRALAGGRIRFYASTFADCYGGLIADGPVPAADRVRLYERLRPFVFAGGRMTENPLADDASAPSAAIERDGSTQMLVLDGEFDSILSDFSSSHRRAWRKGRRMGVAVGTATSLDDFRAYDRLYRLSQRRWGDAALDDYPWRLFENGFEIGRRHPEHVKLWLASVDGSPVSGALVFYAGRHAIYWHGAADADYFDHYPNHVLQGAIIEDALARGFRYYDFGPSAGLAGVEAFKRRFGAERYPFRRWTYGAFRRPRLLLRALRGAGGLRGLPDLIAREIDRRRRAA